MNFVKRFETFRPSNPTPHPLLPSLPLLLLPPSRPSNRVPTLAHSQHELSHTPFTLNRLCFRLPSLFPTLFISPLRTFVSCLFPPFSSLVYPSLSGTPLSDYFIPPSTASEGAISPPSSSKVSRGRDGDVRLGSHPSFELDELRREIREHRPFLSPAC